MNEYLHLDFAIKKQGVKEKLITCEFNDSKENNCKKECHSPIKEECKKKKELDIMQYLLYFDTKINKISEIVDKYEKDEIMDNKDIILKNSIKQIYLLNTEIKKIKKILSLSHSDDKKIDSINEKIKDLESKLNGFDDFVKCFIHLNKKIKNLEDSFHKLESKCEKKVEGKCNNIIIEPDKSIEGNFIIKICNFGDRELTINYSKIKSIITVWASWNISDLVISKLYGTIKLDKISELFPKIKNAFGNITIYNNTVNTIYQGIIIYQNDKLIVKLSNRPIVPILIKCDVNINIDFKIQI